MLSRRVANDLKLNETICDAKYLGYVPLWNNDLQHLDGLKRDILCQECVRRVCEANRILKPTLNIPKVNKNILPLIQDRPNLTYCNEPVQIRLNDGGLIVTTRLHSDDQLPHSDTQEKTFTLTAHLMAFLWAIHKITMDTSNFMAYIGKNEKQQVACYVFSVSSVDCDNLLNAYKRISLANSQLFSGDSITRL